METKVNAKDLYAKDNVKAGQPGEYVGHKGTNDDVPAERSSGLSDAK